MFIFIKKTKIKEMRKGLLILSAFLFASFGANAATTFMPKRFNTVTSHDDVYPYILNNAKTNPNAQKKINYSTNIVSASPIGKRKVVKRKTNARAATANVYNYDTEPQQQRRVVQRQNTVRSATTTNVRTNNARNAQSTQTRSLTPVGARRQNNVRTIKTNSNTTSTKVSSQRCLSDYKECMENYCLREDTAYNRCYCSAKLAQIDSKYQNKIDELIQQIIRLQYNTSATSEEIKEYWDQTVGTYTGDNPWVNIDNALNIEWADTQSRVRGQNAFNTGHQYCVQHLRACSYMATNLRDSYKAEISRDCATYEKSLQKIQAAAESVIESYND